jgi:hypothetical protein
VQSLLESAGFDYHYEIQTNPSDEDHVEASLKRHKEAFGIAQILWIGSRFSAVGA